MRVFLAGPANEREWLRRLLADAGVDVAAEGASAPAASARPDGIDAVIQITAAAPKPGAAYDRPGAAYVRSGAADVRRSPGSSDPGENRLLGTLPEPLTARERQVLALLAEGLPNKGIAAALDISDQTVKFHVASIIGKLGAANRTDAVRRAVRRGLVTL